MDLLSRWFDTAFMSRPGCLLAWPAAAMLVGTFLQMFGGAATQALGIIPRSLSGLLGIVSAPFMHVNFAHFFANLPPFLVLSWLVLLHGETVFLEVALGTALVGGFLVWLLARRASHMGMSGVIFGLLGFLLCVAWRTQVSSDLLIAGGVLLFYGGMLGGVAPARNGSSWEAHLFGLLVGGGLVWVL